MGHWGIESCSSDNCWDRMGNMKNIHECTSREISGALRAFGKVKGYDDREEYLGVAIWGLNHGCTVRASQLRKARMCAKALLKAKDYLENWSGNRKAAIEEELAAIEKAIANDGQGEVKHVKGLLERIETGCPASEEK